MSGGEGPSYCTVWEMIPLLTKYNIISTCIRPIFHKGASGVWLWVMNLTGSSRPPGVSQRLNLVTNHRPPFGRVVGIQSSTPSPCKSDTVQLHSAPREEHKFNPSGFTFIFLYVQTLKGVLVHMTEVFSDMPLKEGWKSEAKFLENIWHFLVSALWFPFLIYLFLKASPSYTFI